MQINTEFRGIPRNSGKFYCKKYREIPRNSAEFRMFFKKFRIPSEVKNALPWTPYRQVYYYLPSTTDGRQMSIDIFLVELCRQFHLVLHTL
jgi:hypothetical protein